TPRQKMTVATSVPTNRKKLNSCTSYKRGVEIMRTKFFALLAVFALAGSAVLVTAARPGGGSITGKETFTGTPPKMKPIDMSKEPYCQKLHNPQIKTQNGDSGRGTTLKDD